MTKEQQKQAWRALPKEVRNFVQSEYQRIVCKHPMSLYELGVKHAFETVYGAHNLSSDKAPSEVLTEQKPR